MEFPYDSTFDMWMEGFRRAYEVWYTQHMNNPWRQIFSPMFLCVGKFGIMQKSLKFDLLKEKHPMMQILFFAHFVALQQYRVCTM